MKLSQALYKTCFSQRSIVCPKGGRLDAISLQLFNFVYPCDSPKLVIACKSPELVLFPQSGHYKLLLHNTLETRHYKNNR